MPSIRVTRFGGIVPRLGARLLPDNNARTALNTKLFSGELRAWNRPRFLGTVPVSSPKTVYRYTFEGQTRLLAFVRDTDVVKAPLINDAFRRLYWADGISPRYNTMQRIEDGLPDETLGVPRAVFSGLAVNAIGGVSDLTETRIYTATLASRYGEEGPVPERVQTVSGKLDAAWTVTGLDTLIYDAAKFTSTTKVYLYRTVTSASSVDYRRVAEFDVDALPSSYVDALATSDAALRPVLESFTWAPPPDDLRGLITLSSGGLAGFRGNEIWFSVPYRPHAWPEEFKLAVEDDIVALGTFGNSVVAATTGELAVATGSSPDAMTLDKGKSVTPCLSKRGLVSTDTAVLFPCPDGLVSVSAGGVAIATQPYVTKTEWEGSFSPETIQAAVYQNRYFAFYSDQLGFEIGFDDPTTGFTETQLPNTSAVCLDRVTGQTLIVQGNRVYEWDADAAQRLTYTWRSKPFLVPKPTNFAAMQLRGDFVGESPEATVPVDSPFAGHALNAYTMNGPSPGGVLAPFGYPLNGVGIPGRAAVGESSVLVRVFADDVLRHQQTVVSEEPFRLPSGFNAVKWEVELIGRVPLLSFAMSTTLKGLEEVP